MCHSTGAAERSGFRATSLETLRQMVAANVGITLLPILAVRPPVACAPNVHLLGFSDHAPSRRIAMVWRKSTAMGPFLKRLSEVIKDLPPSLLDAQPDACREASTARAAMQVG
ncbi:oxidative stress transcriptional regulator [mine drainage metagenome]|uniref:Oxidative stress transcriptional regulator n=1 Tax=mine drainage metagenome TaxID=410659 RepID=T1AJU3_9ZZZZ